MNLTRTTQLRAKRINTAKPSAVEKRSEPAKSATDSKFKDFVVKGAYASGGALAGVGLGVATGGVLGNLMGSSSLTTVGGVLGAVAGAGTAVSLADSDNKKEALTQVALGWGGASVGSGVGQFLATHTLGALATSVGAPVLAEFAPFIGTASGALMGASLPNLESDDKLMKLVRRGAGMSFLGTAGLTAGLLGRSFALNTPGIEHMGVMGPILGAATGLATANSISSEEDSLTTHRAARATFGSTAGYAVGSAAGAFAHLAGGAGAYTVAMPAVGAAIGGLTAYANGPYSERDTPYAKEAGQVAFGLTSTAVGTLVGDGVGHLLTAATGYDIYTQAGLIVGGANGLALGLDMADVTPKEIFGVSSATSAGTVGGALAGAVLTAVTGDAIFNQMGGAVGALNGAVGGLEMVGVDTKMAQPVILSGSAGIAAGALAGTALTAVTGNGLYSQLGAAAGATSATLLAADRTGLLDTKGVADTVAGATGGVGVGALLGASLNALTGQDLWGVALPILGAAAGGLSALAVTYGGGEGS